MGDLYQKLFLLRKAHKALSRGEMIKIASNLDQDVYAFFRVAGRDKVMTVLNFSTEPRAASLIIPMKRLFSGEKRSTLEDVFSNDRISVGSASSDTVMVDLEPQEYRVYIQEK
jgi:glycosidase